MLDRLLLQQEPVEDGAVGGVVERQRERPAGGAESRGAVQQPVRGDPAEGDPEAGIPPGTPFESLPDTWSCPECGATKADFEPID